MDCLIESIEAKGAIIQMNTTASVCFVVKLDCTRVYCALETNKILEQISENIEMLQSRTVRGMDSRKVKMLQSRTVCEMDSRKVKMLQSRTVHEMDSRKVKMLQSRTVREIDSRKVKMLQSSSWNRFLENIGCYMVSFL